MFEPKDVLLKLGKARIDIYNKKLVADEEYYKAEEKFKAIKADVMMSEQVTGLGSRELREAQADLIIAQMPEYENYLQKKFISRMMYERQILISDLIEIAKTLAIGNMLDADAKVLLEGVVEDEETERKD